MQTTVQQNGVGAETRTQTTTGRSESLSVERLLERTQEVYQASVVRSAAPEVVTAPSSDLLPYLDSRIGVAAEKTKLFTGFPIASWPPQKLIKKIVRRLAFPLFQPQIVFNEATRDSLRALRQHAAAQEMAAHEAQAHIARLQRQMDDLEARLSEAQAALSARDNESGIRLP